LGGVGMIKNVQNYEIEDLFKPNSDEYYVIPKYQREYTWGQNQWSDLYDDINENDLGYFIGTIICIDNHVPNDKVHPLEVIDGQQRLTTLSLLILTIFNLIKGYRDYLKDDDALGEYVRIRQFLQSKETDSGLKLILQTQGKNMYDYEAIMHQNGVIKTGTEKENWKRRRIALCYKYFNNRVTRDIEAATSGIVDKEKKNEASIAGLFEIANKIEKALIVRIDVENHAQAYTLFASLNNRGTPLTAIDLMKNLILATADKQKLDYSDCYNRWEELLSLLPDYGNQERFFRQYYNAFKTELNEPFRANDNKKMDPLGSIATRSNLLNIYEQLIGNNLDIFQKDILECGKIYAHFLYFNNSDLSATADSLKNLSHVQGTPSYLLLLYLFKKKDLLNLNDDDINGAVGFLTKFFIRRNITDIPATRDLQRIFMSVIDQIEHNNNKGKDVIEFIKTELKKFSVPDTIFK
jgi:uncharacterized protein with ParB-like and HNH nuclease domain